METQNIKIGLTDTGDSLADMAANINDLYLFFDAIWPIGSVMVIGYPEKYTFDPNTIHGSWTPQPITFPGQASFTFWKRVG